MKSPTIRLALMATLAVGASHARAQAPARADVPAGKTAMDMVRVEPSLATIVLRNGGVIPGSELVDVGGRVLQRGRDYSIDNGSGIIYLLERPRSGVAARVSYRFDPDAAAKISSSGDALKLANLRSFQFSGNQVQMGFGMAERQADGTVRQSDLVGLKNNFSAGSANVKGYMAYGQKKTVQSQSLMGSGASQAGSREGGEAIIQNVDWSLGPGKLKLDYQNIAQKFDGFAGLAGAGYSAAEVNALAKERGLKRTGLAVEDLKVGKMSLTGAQRLVTTGRDKVDWRSLSLNAGAIQASFDRRQVDKNFNRFKDLREGDRDALAREAGFTREAWKMGYTGAKTSLNFASEGVQDDRRQGIQRANADFRSGKFGLSLNRQSVDAGFTRFDGLREADRGQLARERGLRRNGLSLNAGGASIQTSSVEQAQDGEEFVAQDMRFGGKTVQFLHSNRKVGAGFGSLGNLSEAELDAHVKSIGLMYDPNDFLIRPEAKWQMVGGPRLDRQLDRLQWSPRVGTSVLLDQLRMDGANGSGTVQRFGFSTPKFQYNYRGQNFDPTFQEAAGLMDFERDRVGDQAGLRKENHSLQMQWGAGKTFQAETMGAGIKGQGEASRTSVKFTTPGLSASLSEREVGAGFQGVNRLVDPERDLLATLRGYQQRDATLQFSMIKGMSLGLRQSSSYDEVQDARKLFGEYTGEFKPDSQTQLRLFAFHQRDTMGSDLLYENSVERASFSRQIRNFVAKYEQEQVRYDGTQTTAVDSNRQTFGVSAKIDQRTNLATERTEVQYSDGNADHIMTHTLSQGINHNVGIEVSQTSVDRTGDRPDEQRRNYGVWIDFGHGFRLNYGMIRDISSVQAGHMQSNLSMTAGTVGNVKVNGVNYQDQRWDGQRYQSTGNVGFGLVKPLNLGLVHGLTFWYTADTFRDYRAFQRENRWLGANCQVLGADLKFDYKSQIAPSGERAIDRAFRLQSPNADKAPLSAELYYKVRTMPTQKSFAIRDYKLRMRPSKGWELSHALQTNPEVARGDLLLGSLPQAARSSKWRLDYSGNPATVLGLSWDEFRNDANKNVTRLAGMNLKLSANRPSPIEFFYGMEHNEAPGQKRTAHRYHLRFDQRPGPNQAFSLFLGNVSWQNSRDKNLFDVQNWSGRMEYSLKF